MSTHTVSLILGHLSNICIQCLIKIKIVIAGLALIGGRILLRREKEETNQLTKAVLIVSKIIMAIRILKHNNI